MPTVERLIKPSLKQSFKGGWEWSPEYVVSGVTEEIQVFGAVDDTTGLAIPYVGKTEGTLRCEDREISEHPVPGLWFVKTTWKAPEIEGIENEPPPKTRWRWKSGRISRQIGHDIDGKGIVNAAGVPYSESFEDEENTKILTITRREPIYDAAGANAMEGLVNSVPLTVLGISVGVGNMKCNRIEPTTDQDIETGAVDVEWEFELRQGYKPWLLRVPNRGYSGWFTNNGEAQTGEFYHLGGTDPVSEPVMLGDNGIPIFSDNYVVKSDPHSGVDSFAIATPNLPTHFEIAPESTAEARILIFKTRQTFNFAGLLPPVM